MHDFGVIESTKTWLEIANPNLSGHWSHFIAGEFKLAPIRSRYR